MKPMATKLSDDQYELFMEIARRELGADITPSQALRDLAVREFVLSRKHRWPADYIGEGGKTKWGGERRGSGRRKLKGL